VIWVTYRQHRVEILSLGGLLAVIALYLVITGHIMGNSFADNGVAACLVASPPPSCSGVVNDFTGQFDTVAGIAALFAVLPIVVGIFIGAPLLAREFERGTIGLAWTQSVTRGRWLAIKLVAMVALGIVAAVIFTVMMTLWRGPLDQAGSRLDAGFDVEGVVEVGYFLFALSLGALVGTILRRTLPAMAVTLVGFILVRGPVEFWLRAHYVAPITATSPSAANPPIPGDAWRLSSQFVDASGNTLSRGQIVQLCGGSSVGEEGVAVPSQCFASHGIVRQTLYQPADRFWSFQFIEVGIFLALAIACLILTVLWVRRRIG
jgi:ABC-type transport system involved in multi-copper enzyme maturation permease subunit